MLSTFKTYSSIEEQSAAWAGITPKLTLWQRIARALGMVAS